MTETIKKNDSNAIWILKHSSASARMLWMICSELMLDKEINLKILARRQAEEVLCAEKRFLLGWYPSFLLCPRTSITEGNISKQVFRLFACIIVSNNISFLMWMKPKLTAVSSEAKLRNTENCCPSKVCDFVVLS